MSWNIMKHPEESLITIDEFERHLRYDASDSRERDHMQQCLLAAENYVGNYIGAPVQHCRSKWTFLLNTDFKHCIPIKSPLNGQTEGAFPVWNVTQICDAQIYNGEEWHQVDDAFTIKPDSTDTFVCDKQKLPKFHHLHNPPVELTFEAGYSRSTLPKIIKNSLLQIATAFFDGRTEAIKSFIISLEAYRPKKIV